MFIQKIRSSRFAKPLAAITVLTVLNQFVIGNSAFALTSGPSQPEVQGFQPIGASNNVDLFTGDFSYNIPLFTIGNYPINLSYNSNISADDEASWVGLGWTLNPGAINRQMRGLPDDFNGEDKVKEIITKKPRRTVTFPFSLADQVYETKEVEVAGKKVEVSSRTGKVDLNVNASLTFDNYKGFSLAYGLGYQSKFFGLSGISGSSTGIDLNPSFSFSDKFKNKKILKRISSASLSINSHEGLSNFAFGLNALNLKLSSNLNSSFRRMLGTSFDFALPSVMPPSSYPYHNSNRSVTLSFGKEKPFVYKKFNAASVTVVVQKQEYEKEGQSLKGIGYIYADKSDNKKDEILDFNIESPTELNEETTKLGVPIQTYDLFSINAQGLNGQFRFKREKDGVISNTVVNNKSSLLDNVDLGAELGIGLNSLKFGVDISLNLTSEESKIWNGNSDMGNYNYLAGSPIDNQVYPIFTPTKSSITDNTLENYYEQNTNKEGVIEPVISKDKGKFILSNQFRYSENSTRLWQVSQDKLSKREPRSVAILSSTFGQTFGYLKSSNQFPSHTLSQNLAKDHFSSIMENTINQSRSNHHLNNFTVLNESGSRYVYGKAVYTNETKQVSFAVGSSMNLTSFNNISAPFKSYSLGLISYNVSDASPSNSKGIDNHYSEKTIPAYANSFLLTEVLAPNYEDVDQNGPTPNDNGDYTKFSYVRIHDEYNFVAPFPDLRANNNYPQASWNLYSLSDETDDKGEYTFGSKEITYLHSIESKNEIAVFFLSDRIDGLTIDGQNSKNISSKRLKKLDKIEIYTRNEFYNKENPTPIKTVHFVYNYFLCPNTFNNINYINGSSSNTGKLTLAQVYFTYGDNSRGKLNKYRFSYGTDESGNTFNPNYHPKAFDGWGNYRDQRNRGTSEFPLYNQDFPFVDQDNVSNLNKFAMAYKLTDITLPSGADMHIEYESDDYAYVQDKPAMVSKAIFGFSGGTKNSTFDNNSEDGRLYNGSSINNSNNTVYFKMDPGTSVENYFRGASNSTHISTLVNLTKGSSFLTSTNSEYEYINGNYFIIPPKVSTSYSGSNYIGVKLVGESVNSKLINFGEISNYNPITLRAMDYIRLNRPKLYMPGSSINSSNTSIKDVAYSLLNIIPNTYSLITGPYIYLGNSKLCRDVYRPNNGPISNSFISVTDPDQRKYGGGARVKKVTIRDGFDDKIYGQEYDYSKYVNGKNISSGVASYEPYVMGAENPLKTPMTNSANFSQKPLSRYARLFHSVGPVGETFYPNPLVGYSQVTVRALTHTNITRHQAGRTVHQFYTAKDFPTISESSTINSKYDADFTPIFTSKKLALAQGFTVITNDMHGKQKAIWEYSYQENSLNDGHFAPTREESPISGTEYKYFTKGSNNNELNCYLKVVDGAQIKTAPLGLDFEIHAMGSEIETKHTLAGLELNLDVTFVPTPVPSFTVFPDYKNNKSNTRSFAICKVIRKCGTISKVIVHKEGSVLSTENLVFDPITARPLYTVTQTQYKNTYDYNQNVPAYLVNNYKRMGPAYENLAYEFTTNINSGEISNSSIVEILKKGDELRDLTNGTKYWVLSTTSSQAALIDKDGNKAPNLSNVKFRVERSGNRNQLNTDVASFQYASDNISNSGNFIPSNATNVLGASFTSLTEKGQMMFNKPGSCVNNTNSEEMDKMIMKSLANLVSKVLTSQAQKHNGYLTEKMKKMHAGDLSDYDKKRDTEVVIRQSGYNFFEIDPILLEYIKQKNTGNTSTSTYFNKPKPPIEKLSIWLRYSTEMDNQKANGLGNEKNWYKANAKATGLDIILRATDVKNNVIYFCPFHLEFDDYNLKGNQTKNLWGIANFIIGNLQGMIIPQGNCIMCPKFIMLGNDFTVNGSGSNQHLEITSSNTVLWSYASGLSSLGKNAFVKNIVVKNSSGGLLYDNNGNNPDFVDFKDFHISLNSAINSSNVFKPDGYINPTYGSTYNSAYKISLKKSNGSAHSFILKKYDINSFNGYNNDAPEYCECESCFNCSDLHAVTSLVNPFLYNLEGKFSPHIQYAFNNNSKRTTGQIKSSGYYSNFSFPLTKSLSIGSFTGWVITEKSNVRNPNMQIIQSTNALNIPSSILTQFRNSELVKAAAQNAKHSEIGNINFEELIDAQWANQLCPIFGQFNFSDALSDRIAYDNNESHSGWYSLRVNGNTESFSCTSMNVPTTNNSRSGGLQTQYPLLEENRLNSFKLINGKDYLFSYWIKGENTENAALDIYQMGSCPSTVLGITGTKMNTIYEDEIKVDGWIRRTHKFTPTSSGSFIVKISNSSSSPVYIDDIRIAPLDAVMKSFVYDPYTLRLMAQLDENNFATFFEYDSEGNLVRTKIETERGVMTVNENRQRIKPNH